MTDQREDGEFREYTVTEMIAALSERDGDEVLVLEVQDPRGRTLFADVTDLCVGSGNDIDRQGVYRWTVITGRLEARTPDPFGTTFKVRDVPLGSVQGMVDADGYAVRRTIVDRLWDGPEPNMLTLMYDDGSTQPYPYDYRIVVFPPDPPAAPQPPTPAG